MSGINLIVKTLAGARALATVKQWGNRAPPNFGLAPKQVLET